MTVGLLAPHVILLRGSLAALRLLRDQIMAEGIEGVNLQHLSMGMSADLEIAIQEGSTMVRIGTDVFGKRDLPPRAFWPRSRNLKPPFPMKLTDDRPNGFLSQLMLRQNALQFSKGMACNSLHE